MTKPAIMCLRDRGFSGDQLRVVVARAGAGGYVTNEATGEVHFLEASDGLERAMMMCAGAEDESGAEDGAARFVADGMPDLLVARVPAHDAHNLPLRLELAGRPPVQFVALPRSEPPPPPAPRRRGRARKVA